jgi:glycosyltransferase involved in cell wall biosynthesis/thymidylate kinase
MKKKIKVGIFVEGRFLPSYDGASNRFHYLSRFLQLSQEVDIVIFHCHRGYTDIKLVKDEPFVTYLISEENYYNNLELLATIIQKEQIDILQFNDLEPILYQGIRLSKMTDTKLIYEIHYDPVLLAKTLGEKAEIINNIIKIQGEVGKNIDYAICLSSDDKNDLIENLRIKQSEFEVIPSGVDLNENKYHIPNLKSKTIVFLGNLYFKPNEDAIRILKKNVYPKLSDQGFSFILAGDYPKKIKEELGKKNFDFIGPVGDLNLLFAKAGVCVAPIFEGTGIRIKFLNFMSGGIPILTTQIATNGFTDKDNFFIEDNVERYAEKIIDLFQSKKLIEISKKNRKFIEQNYSWQKIAGRVIKAYEEILNKDIKTKTAGIEILNKPAWLSEAIRKNRYKVIQKLPPNFSFSKVSNGNIESFSLKQIIAIEGMPGAGKTTFVKNLHAKNIKTIKELSIGIPKDIKSNFRIQQLFMLSEKGKYKKAVVSFKDNEKIILDRSFISTLAYSYAYCKTRNNMTDYEKILNLVKNIKHEILWPTKVIVLDCSIKESIKRRNKFKNVIEYKKWFDKDFLLNFKDFYDNELSKILNIRPVFIDTSDKTILEVDKVIKEIL